MSEIAPIYQHPALTLEQVIVGGDLAALKPEERLEYYNNVCKSVGLNPLTRPLEYIKLNGKLTLYARKDCADQLRKINGVNCEILDRRITEGVAVVHVKATDKTGRHDEDIGVVAAANLRGDALANALMKAVTKAKRRVTLSICGLGWLDESEIESIPNAEHVEIKDDQPEPPKNPNPLTKAHHDFIVRLCQIFEFNDPTDDETTDDQYPAIKKQLLDDAAGRMEDWLTVADNMDALAACSEGVTALEKAKHVDAGALRELHESKRLKFIKS